MRTSGAIFDDLGRLLKSLGAFVGEETAYIYDARGNITRDTRVIQTPGQLAQTYVTQYAWDIADRPVSMTYPGGRIVEYARDSIGRVTAVDTRASELATPVALASAGTYQPFGPLDGLSRGKGVSLSRIFDLDGRISALDNILNGATTVLALDYQFDLSGDITKITDAGGGLRGRNYVYDALHRLIDTEELLGDGLTVARGTSFGYDAVGNRTRRSVSLAGVSETEDYVNDSLSNQFQSSSIKVSIFTVQSRSLTHGDSGNRESDVASGIALNLNYAMAYDATDRLASVSDGATVLGAYIHNAMGQRVSKTRSTGAVTHYLYDLSGRLIAEADGATGITHSEYIAFEGINLAYITTAGIYWVHGDHLGTPQMLTDELGAEAWSALYAPFGMLLEETGALDFNLRFPGQYHDAETEFYYNYFRTYDPTSGRYVESDPIGLDGGWNTYGYVQGNPVMRVDPRGLTAAQVKAVGQKVQDLFPELPVPTKICDKTGEIEPGVSADGSYNHKTDTVCVNKRFFDEDLKCPGILDLFRVIIHEVIHRRDYITDYAAAEAFRKSGAHSPNNPNDPIYNETKQKLTEKGWLIRQECPQYIACK